MSDAEWIRDLVRRTERRIARLALQDAASRALTLALGACAIVVLGTRLGWWRVPLVATFGLPVAVLAVVAVVWRTRRRSRAGLAASRLDAEYSLDDRIRTALHVLDSPRPHAFDAALVADAASVSAVVEPSRAVPYRAPAWAIPLATATVAFATALALPTGLIPGGEARAAEVGAVREAGRLLEERSTPVAERRAEISEQLRSLAREQAELGAALSREPTPAKEALARLSRMDERLDAASRQLEGAKTTAARTRRALARSLEAAGKRGDATDAGSTEGAEAQRSMSKDARAAAERARSGELSHEDAEAIAQAASKLSKELDATEANAELRDALAAIQDGEASAEDLERLANALEGAESRARDTEAAEALRAANRAAKQQAAGRTGGKPGDGADGTGDASAKGKKPGPYAGHGSTNDPEGTPYDAETANSTMQNSDARPDTKGTYEAKGKEARIGEQGYSASVKGRLDGQGKATSLFVQGAPGSAPSSAPYQQVYPQYRRTAERAVARSGIPPEQRTAVRDYFDAINPDAHH